MAILMSQALQFFFMQRHEIDLSSNLRIRPVTKAEKFPEGTTGGHYGWGLEHGYPNLHFVVDSLNDSMKASIEIERLATTLLLFKTHITMRNELEWLRLGAAGSESARDTKLPPLNPKELEEPSWRRGDSASYLLKFGEVDDFVSFWRQSTSHDWPPNLLAASRRLLVAQNRVGEHFHEDRLIDFVIAFEALLVRKNERSKGDAMSQRGGKLTGLTTHLLKDAIDQLALAYDLRNDIVHDGFFDTQDLRKLRDVGIYPSLDELLTRVEQNLRTAMREYVALTNRGLTKHQIILTL